MYLKIKKKGGIPLRLSMKKGMVLLFAILFILNPIKASAHEALFYQVLIDQNTMNYQVNIVEDNAGWTSNEAKHFEAQLGDFLNFDSVGAKKNGILTASGRNSVPAQKYTKSPPVGGEQILPYTFPPMEVGDVWFDGKPENDAGKSDADRAYLIKDYLAPGLNDALNIVNDGKQFSSIKELIKASSAVASGSYNGWTIKYGERISNHKALTNAQKKTGLTDSDFAHIYKVVSGKKVEFEFVYRIVKGYSTSGNPLYDSGLKDDTKYMSWHMMMYQANYSYANNGWTAKDASEIAKVGPLEEAIVSLFENMFNGLRNLLGLYNMNELIFNDGIRGSSAWHYGIMPISWEKNVLMYHWIFQGFAWTLIAFAMVKALIQRNLSTINPSMRISLIESIQNLMITGFILANIFPLINMFLFLNVKVVAIFATLAPDFTNLSGMNNYSNAISGIILQFFYLVISLYLNFVYILRSITLAILIAMAPLFVVTLAFGGKWKALFGMWMRELLSNIFIQSFHAFILGFFVTTTITSRGIEGLVVAFAMIPLTEFFRSIVMGGGGGITHQLGLGAVSTGASMLGGIAKSNQGSKNGNSNSSGGSGGGGGSEGGSSGASNDGTQRTNRNGETMQANQKNGGSNKLDTHDAQKDKGIPLDVYTKGTAENATADEIAMYDMYKGQESNPIKAGIQDGAKALASGFTPSNIAQGAVGMAKVGMGIGVGLALGGTGVGAGTAGNLISSGLKDTKSSAKVSGSAIKSAGSSVIGGLDRQFPAPQGSSSKSETLSANEGVTRLNNGDLQVHRDSSHMNREGILRANDDSNGNSVYTYDTSRLGDTDRANVEHYAQVFQSGSSEDKAWLRANGVQNVDRTADGHYRVAYNDVGKEQLGIKGVRTLGDRVVETKSSDAPMETYKTVNIQQAPARVSPILDHRGENMNVPSNPVPNADQSRPTQRPVQNPQEQQQPQPSGTQTPSGIWIS